MRGAIAEYIDPLDKELREIVAKCARGEEVDLSLPRPEGFPEITLIMIVKNEWMTLMRCVESVLPIVSEIVIGVDSETDTPIAMAYQEAYERKPRAACDKFFEKFLPDNRYATFKEIAKFLGLQPKEFEWRCNKRAKEKPTWEAALAAVDLVGKGEAFEIEFKSNFSDSRNETIKRATGEYCIFLDGHERMEGAERLLSLLPDISQKQDWYHWFFLLDERDTLTRHQIQQNRLFKKTPEAHFERGIHNRLVIPEAEGVEGVYAEGVVLVHDRPAWLAGFRNTQRQAMTAEHMSDENDSSALYYSAINAQKRGEVDKAIDLFDKYLTLASESPEAAYVCWLLGRELESHKSDMEGAERVWREGLRRCPDAAWLWLDLSRMEMGRAKAAEEDGERDRHAHRALSYARIASGCKSPIGTMAIPTTPFSWEPALRMAEIYGFLKSPEDALPYVERVAQYERELPQDILPKVAQMYWDTKFAASQKVSEEHRLSPKDGVKRLAIFGGERDAVREILEVGENKGYAVEVYNDFHPAIAYRSDVWWVEGAGDNARLASNTWRGDRQLFIRCHQDDVWRQGPSRVNWENSDANLVTAGAVADSLAQRFGLDRNAFRVLPQYPDPERFPVKRKHGSKDIVMMGAVGSGLNAPLIHELARLVPDRTIYVGGTAKDEREMEALAELAVFDNVANIDFRGHISEAEKNEFYALGGHFVCLSPWNPSPYECYEAEACGIPVYCLAYSWAADRFITATNVQEIAALIEDGFAPLPDMGEAHKRYTSMRETINAILP